MEANERRSTIIKLLNDIEGPISGSELATKFGVTRQVIVQDIAILRAQSGNILSTSKGYMLQKTLPNYPRRVFAVKHEREEIEDELNTIIDFGGTVIDVIVAHPIYETITCNLLLKSRQDIKGFIKQLETYQTVPLMRLTHGEHYHTVEAENTHILDQIEASLKEKGYLLNI